MLVLYSGWLLGSSGPYTGVRDLDRLYDRSRYRDLDREYDLDRDRLRVLLRRELLLPLKRYEPPGPLPFNSSFP